MQLFTDTVSDAIQAEAFYTRHFPALVRVATTRFAIPEEKAEDLADAILTSSLRHLAAMEDPRAWLLGALTSAATRKGIEA